MKNYETLDLGYITLGDNVMVSDPCYKLGTWCQDLLEDVLPGRYRCSLLISDEGEWGKRVAFLTASHSDVENITFDLNDLESESGDIGVDSGMCGIFDYEFYKRFADNEELYDECCKIDFGDSFGDTDKLAVISSSGYGDGCYDLLVNRNDEGKVNFICLDYFI